MDTSYSSPSVLTLSQGKYHQSCEIWPRSKANGQEKNAYRTVYRLCSLESIEDADNPNLRLSSSAKSSLTGNKLYSEVNEHTPHVKQESSSEQG